MIPYILSGGMVSHIQKEKQTLH